jgi:hypothetical protein
MIRGSLMTTEHPPVRAERMLITPELAKSWLASNPRNRNKIEGWTADKRLRAAHSEEWNRYMTEEAKSQGIEWTPRLTDEEKARKQYEDLLAKYPHLAQRDEPLDVELS